MKWNKEINKKIDSETLTTERIYAPHLSLGEKGIMEHLGRYNFALNILKETDIVLDAACGSGYGSDILAIKAKQVTALDFSDHAINYAQKNYPKSNIVFKKVDLNKKIDLADNSIDVIVSFETLEHVLNQDSMLGEFKRVLKPEGKLIISTPDNDIISGGIKSDNPYHVKELSKDQFISLIGKYFSLIELYDQGILTELPFWKRFLKKFRKITFLRKLKQRLMKFLGLEKAVHSHFAAEAFTEITKVSATEKNFYYVLIAVCANKK
jgi:2-polyprenyl-3-methyl-5-hydroxy-6-metoxy-1,4-benzoquinol methylase